MEDLGAQVVELINDAKLSDKDEQLSKLAQIQEILIHRDQSLLPGLVPALLEFQTDQTAATRRWVVEFIESVVKINPSLLPQLLGTLQFLASSEESETVVQKIVAVTSKCYRRGLQQIVSCRMTPLPPAVVEMSHALDGLKQQLLQFVDHTNGKIRLGALKFLEIVICVDSHPSSNGYIPGGEYVNLFTLSHIPQGFNYPNLDPATLQREGHSLLERLCKLATDGASKLDSFAPSQYVCILHSLATLAVHR